MQIHVHLGVHFTDPDGLSRAFEASQQGLASEGVRLGHPGIWQPALRDALSGQRRNRLAADWLETTLGTRNLRRLVLIDPDLLGQPVHLLRDGVFYHGAGSQMRHLVDLFRDHSLSVSLNLIAPGAFVDALRHHYDPDGVRSFGDHVDMHGLTWFPVVRAIREAAPHVPVLVSRFEDRPLVWPYLLRDIADVPGNVPLEADDFLVRQMLPPNALERLQGYLDGHELRTESQYAQIIRSFLTLYGVAQDLDNPAGRLRERAKERNGKEVTYSGDMASIAGLPGVHVLRV